MSASRLVKPSIPAFDDDAAPIRHELEFELLLLASASARELLASE